MYLQKIVVANATPVPPALACMLLYLPEEFLGRPQKKVSMLTPEVRKIGLA